MRYRPLAATGLTVSNLTLSLGYEAVQQGRDKALDLLYAALENGINSYLLENADPVLAEVLGEALSHVDRQLVCVAVTLGVGDRQGSGRDFSAEGMTGAIDRVLRYSNLRYIDLGLLHEPGEMELPQSSLNALKAQRAAERIRLLGVAGDHPVMDAYLSTNAFDALLTPYGLDAEWPVRNRLKMARERDMAIMAYDFYSDRHRPAAQPVQRKRGLFGLGGRAEPERQARGQYQFLHQTPNWTAEAICLTYAMTEPAIASAVIRTCDPAHLHLLAEATERDLPAGLAAQIEIARVQPSAA